MPIRSLPLLFVPAALCLGGCYDGQVMVARVSQHVSDDHREEVDLGAYHVTLPRKVDDLVATTIRLEVVATIHRQNARAFKKQLDQVQARLRHATIMALRSCDREALVEPELATLHERIESTTAQYLTSTPIESIAFRSFAVYED